MSQFLDSRTLKAIGILLAAGVLVSVSNNLLASKTRRLDWVQAYPAKGKPKCPETLPVEGAASSTTEVPDTEPVAVSTEPTPAATTSPIVDIVDIDPVVVPASATAGTEPPTPAPATTPAPTPPPPTGATAAPVPASVEIPPIPSGQMYVEITPEQVKALFDRGATFVDARRTEQYEEGHVKGAISIPVWESGVDDKVSQVVFESGGMESPVVVYCGGGDCEDSHMLGEKLALAGHSSIYIYKDGFPDWSRRSHPSTKGAAR